MEIPQLVMSYYDLHRHSLSPVLSLLAHDSNVAAAFPAPMLQSTSGCMNGLHRVRTTASRLWLCRSPQRRL
jgi:hypothetical protein